MRDRRHRRGGIERRRIAHLNMVPIMFTRLLQLPAEVRTRLRQQVAGDKMPKVWEFVAELPREDSGKIFKRKLRAPYWENAGRNI